jgi:hypothetical protein
VVKGADGAVSSKALGLVCVHINIGMPESTYILLYTKKPAGPVAAKIAPFKGDILKPDEEVDELLSHIVFAML